MKRPNRNEVMPKNNFQGTYPKYTTEEYITAMEIYLNHLEEEKSKGELAITCLKNMDNPIAYLKEEATKDGCVLDGMMAQQTLRSGMFYQELARRTLRELGLII